ncbi:hypothetical protein EVAR_100739_1 [Eumeta japonica]|uniref:Uncharacterized protein n=1 Tax=Eumeta variegata TaxID=151549 RepID=A0A4C1ZU38_EUMVA|nr:hypothetical protein EVAR_100739_1 [Eumeta japonica]
MPEISPPDLSSAPRKSCGPRSRRIISLTKSTLHKNHVELSNLRAVIVGRHEWAGTQAPARVSRLTHTPTMTPGREHSDTGTHAKPSYARHTSSPMLRRVGVRTFDARLTRPKENVEFIELYSGLDQLRKSIGLYWNVMKSHA